MRLHPTARLGASLALVAAFAIGSLGCAGAAGDGRTLSPRSPAEAAATPTERTRLAAGHVVTRPLEFERGDAQYVGGVAMGVVRASPEEVLAALGDVESMAALLPRTKRATLIDSAGGGKRVELVQGNSIVEARYTVRIVPAETPGRLEFQLDRSRPHDIQDVYGYFAVERFDDQRSVVTVAAAVDVGSGLTHLLFARKVQDVILSTPHLMRDYFAQKSPEDRAGLVARNEAR